MKLIHFEETDIKGITTRTCNVDEMSNNQAKIPGLWKQFSSEIAPHLSDDATVVGVYYDYEFDSDSHYSFMAGTDDVESLHVKHLDSVRIDDQFYICFIAEGTMPDALKKTWREVSDFFASGEEDHQRAYSTDFEVYMRENQVAIYISIL